MTIIPIHDFYIFNTEIVPVTDHQQKENSGSVYEVLRIIRGVPLFLSDHIKRLIHSAELANLTFSISEKEIEDLLFKLIQENQVTEGNVLLSYKENLEAFFIPHKYPGYALYENGIQLGILQAERENPNAKMLQTEVRKRADELMVANDFYEVLLVDHTEKVTEGSRSNVFFIRNNKIITPPANEVLLGITREKVLQLAAKLDVEVEERSVYLSELATINAAFITGTSPKVLPVRQIEELFFDPKNQIVSELIRAYDTLIEEYISAR
ncbi:MAG: aminotransferase class IV family protein [Prolixibacteraceae bacterium]|nr:aminotransferase class IV family protein [Prolixibacteraceae bacterium]